MKKSKKIIVNEKNQIVKKVLPTAGNRNSICPFDSYQLVKSSSYSVEDNGRITTVKTKICPRCKRRFINVEQFEDMSVIGIGKLDFYNLNLKKKAPRTILSASDKSEAEHYKKIRKKAVPSVNLENIGECYVALKSMNYYKKCRDVNCGAVLKEIAIKWVNSKGKTKSSEAKVCPVCGKYMIPYGVYESKLKAIRCINSDELWEYEEKRKERKLSREKKQMQQKTKKQQYEQDKKAAVEMLKRQEEEKKRFEKGLRINEFEKIVKEASKEKRRINDNEIRMQDFLIKRNVFHCIHFDHSLNDITASITVLNQKGQLEIIKVSAGYCSICNVFFIMDDAYKKIQSKGIPLCRVFDWKTIAYEETAGSLNLARESLLHQYGYNVNANENLPTERRQRILQILVDNHIMTKSEIVSYLDFFISQRKNNKSMKHAIEKWTMDKQFIQDYKNDTLPSYEIGSLKRISHSRIIR